MIPPLSIAAAIELLLVIAEALFPPCRRFLPLGGTHIGQLGILFGGAFALYELFDNIKAFAG